MPRRMTRRPEGNHERDAHDRLRSAWRSGTVYLRHELDERDASEGGGRRHAPGALAAYQKPCDGRACRRGGHGGAPELERHHRYGHRFRKRGSHGPAAGYLHHPRCQHRYHHDRADHRVQDHRLHPGVPVPWLPRELCGQEGAHQADWSVGARVWPALPGYRHHGRRDEALGDEPGVRRPHRPGGRHPRAWRGGGHAHDARGSELECHHCRAAELRLAGGSRRREQHHWPAGRHPDPSGRQHRHHHHGPARLHRPVAQC